MKITKRQLRKIIREAVEDMEMEDEALIARRAARDAALEVPGVRSLYDEYHGMWKTMDPNDLEWPRKRAKLSRELRKLIKDRAVRDDLYNPHRFVKKQ